MRNIDSGTGSESVLAELSSRSEQDAKQQQQDNREPGDEFVRPRRKLCKVERSQREDQASGGSSTSTSRSYFEHHQQRSSANCDHFSWQDEAINGTTPRGQPNLGLDRSLSPATRAANHLMVINELGRPNATTNSNNNNNESQQLAAASRVPPLLALDDSNNNNNPPLTCYQASGSHQSTASVASVAQTSSTTPLKVHQVEEVNSTSAEYNQLR